VTVDNATRKDVVKGTAAAGYETGSAGGNRLDTAQRPAAQHAVHNSIVDVEPFAFSERQIVRPVRVKVEAPVRGRRTVIQLTITLCEPLIARGLVAGVE